MFDAVAMGPYLGLDNMIVAVALAPLCRDARDVRLLATSFVGVEAAAPIVGALLLPGVTGFGFVALLASAGLLTLGLAVLGLALASMLGYARPPAERHWLTAPGIVGIALALGIDNLAAGSTLPVSAAFVAGLTSGAAVALACVATFMVGRQFAPSRRTVAGAVLLVVAGAAGLT